MIAQLEEWHLEHLTGDAEQVAAEMANNAILHGRGLRYSVTLIWQPDHVVVEVWDGSREFDRGRKAGRDDESGRGLMIVTALAREWGIYPWEKGKVFWATVA